MLDVKELRRDFESVKKNLLKRGSDYSIDSFLAFDKERLALLSQVEELKAEQNKVAKEIGFLKSKGENAESVLKKSAELKEKIENINPKLTRLEEKINSLLSSIPNIPNELVPIGDTDEQNIEIKKYGTIPSFNFEPKAHWDLGTELNILDFERGASVTGSRFTFFKGLGAKLERAIGNFMVNTHIDNGYIEIIPPVIVNENSLFGTGQLPKFEEDLFKLSEKDYYLSPTAEVPVTNLHKNEILFSENLPISYTALSNCFRAEAGSSGRDTRGIIRQHQFSKVELVKFTKPEDSYSELEKLLNDAERVLQLLELPYRVVRLCTGDLGFSSAMTYDIEVWMPSYNKYVEISSCSNFEGFQARRANIRYKEEIKGKAQTIHTLNGSGLAIGRTFAAILENYQQEDGSVIIPKALQSYMGVDKLS
ncbi:MAG: serine--tRNA ligase [Defluviitaleaceae bacterium]|nr:serine--tRNA ligase [Defluviitaleaceae bacterium]